MISIESLEAKINELNKQFNKWRVDQIDDDELSKIGIGDMSLQGMLSVHTMYITFLHDKIMKLEKQLVKRKV